MGKKVAAPNFMIFWFKNTGILLKTYFLGARGEDLVKITKILFRMPFGIIIWCLKDLKVLKSQIWNFTDLKIMKFGAATFFPITTTPKNLCEAPLRCPC